ncbi:MAG TPA: MlaD family protein [Pseudonocardia sp.]|jgi:phospholipid/cholesterol/gamma-HCH transport system substrate-binding protein|uniref:MlaD family protein n=1 Tax=Pseudonocardia sp. TaxID=60912 RepID=UPI002F41EAAA
MSRLHRNGIRALVAAVCVGLTSLCTVAATSNQSGTIKVTATMSDATPLRNGNIVRAAGVEVGSVDSVTLNDQDQAVVTMSVDSGVLPLHKDATATLIPQDLLGERFVALDQGSPQAPPMTAPYSIPVSQTKSAVDLQSVVDMVDNPTGTSLAMMLTTLGEGIGKNPKETADAIAALQPALTNVQSLSQVLSDQNQLLSRLVQNAQPVADAVATRRGASLDRLVGSATQTLQATAQNREALQATLQRLPGTLQSAQVTLAHIAGVAPPTTATLRDIRPLTDKLTDVSDELREFSKATDPALSSLRPVLDKGKDLLDQVRPVVADLRPGGGDLRGVTSSYRQLADGALSTRLVDLMEFMKGWTLSTSDYDAFSHYFRAVTPYTPKTLGQTGAGPIPGAPQNPVPNLPLPRGGRPPLPGDAHNAAPEPKSLPQLPGPSSGATGLSPNQENSMMDQLLGGG